MSFNSFIKKFLPKDRIFFTLFEEVCNNLKSMALDYQEYLNHKPDQVDELLVKLEEGEHHNDSLTHKIFIELGKNFITPFDREDIHILANTLDDVADYMYASVKKLHTYNVTEVDQVMKEMADLVAEGTNALAKAVHELRNMKDIMRITKSCIAINSIENKADDLLDKALFELFRDTTDAIQIIKLKDIYQDMEIITDKCEEAANVIESIIVKYA